MRIVVTGGSGRVGRFVVAELAAAGHDVTSVDSTPASAPVPGVRAMIGDVGRVEDVYGALTYAKADAVVHMAAWSDPGIVADSRTYADNTRAAFNVLDVAAALKLRRVILASSAQVYGFAGHDPTYAPVDEDHPLRPLNSYALSKVINEQAGGYFAGRGLSVLSFRIMGARAPEALATEVRKARADGQSERFLLWTRVDARDIAIACRQALDIEHVASGAYNITGAQNVFGMETAELLRRYASSTPIRGQLAGSASALSCAKAHDAFGYAPRFSVPVPAPAMAAGA